MSCPGADDPLESTVYQAPDEQRHAQEQSREAPRTVAAEVPAIPGYVLHDLLGAGTYGEVFAGVQTRTGQRVAVKVFTRPGALDWLYFRTEVQRLREVAEHPHVVTLLDADLNHEPPYLVMPLLLGGSLAARATDPERKVTSEQAARWLEQMAQALHYIHGKGMLHCDLKPANVLLDTEDRARLVDFGQSQRTAQASSALGTLGYMAPDQVEAALGAEGVAPDPAWDLYSLGATVYYLLAGEPPRLPAAARERFRTQGDAGERLRHYWMVVTTSPLTPLRQINPSVDPDLAAIVERCLEVDPGRRTETAADVLEDLERRRDHRPLLCRRPWTPEYQARRFLMRHGPMVVQGALFLFLLLLGGWVASAQVDKALQSVQSASAARSQAPGGEAPGAPGAEASPAGGDVPRVDPRPLAGAADGLAEQAQAEGQDVAASLLRAEAAAWKGFPAAEDPTPNVAWMAALPDRARSLAFSPDGRWLALRLWNGQAKVLAVPSGRPLQDGSLSAAAFSPGGQSMLLGFQDGSAGLWSPGTGRPLGSRAGTGAAVTWAAYSRDGRRALTASADGTVRLWAPGPGGLTPGGPVLRLGAPAMAAAFSADARQVVTVASPGTVQVWDARTGQPASRAVKAPEGLDEAWFSGRDVVARTLDGRVVAVRTKGSLDMGAGMSEDGLFAVVNGADGQPGVAGTLTGQGLGLLGEPPPPPQDYSYLYEEEGPRYPGPATFAVFEPRGEAVLIGRSDGSSEVYDVLDGTRVARIERSALPPSRFSPTGQRLALSGSEGPVHLASLEEPEPYASLAHESPAALLAWSPDERWLATVTGQGVARMWRLSPRPNLARDPDLPGEALRLQAQVDTGCRLDRSGRPVPLSPEEWATRRAALDRLLEEHARR